MNQSTFIKKYNTYWPIHRLRFILAFTLFLFLSNVNLSYAQIPSAATFLQARFQAIDSLFAPTSTHANFKPALIDKIEIRTSTDNFEPEERDYRIRFSPTTRKIRNAQKNLFQSYKDLANLEKSSFKEDYIEAVYKDILKALKITKELTFKEALLSNLEDQKKVIQKLTLQSINPPKEWLGIQRDISDLQIELYQLKAAQDVLDFTITPSDGLPTIAILQRITEATLTTGIEQNASQEIQLETQLIEQEIALEKAEQNQWFEFVQFQVDNSSEDLSEQKIDFSVSFVLPTAPRRNLKIAELQIEKELLKTKDINDQQQAEEEEKALEKNIQLLYKTLEFTRQITKENQQQAQALLNKSQQNEMANPLLILQLQEQEVKNKLDILDLEMDIYEEYLEWLIVTGRLFQQPYQNLLGF